MKYRILWHDYEDDHSGEPIQVEASSPKEAYFKASTALDEFIGKPNMHYIEVLIDENGKPYNPDFELPDEQSTEVK
ncbi:MAG: hypothetical protein HY934_01125 [Candidatus Firestonebacteria bacterium]|nr:hypothetical protein [Candidatus Firestonebacteria bacterium]